LDDGLDPGMDRGQKPRSVATVLWAIFDQIDAIRGIEPQGWLGVRKDKRTVDQVPFNGRKDLLDLLEVVRVERGGA
jgi:hypothetical protein